MPKTFSGGIHLKDQKDSTADKPTRKAPAPHVAILPLQQHAGAPAEPKVAAGETVQIGQLLADSEKFITAAIHSPVCGKVMAIEPRRHPNGSKVLSIIIENSGEATVHPSVIPSPPPENLSPDQIRQLVRRAGIVGMGGGAFPAHVKLAPPAGKKIEYAIINGAECEPYLTGDYRLMLEQPESILRGLWAIMLAAGAARGIIAIESNKPEAIRILSQALQNLTLPQNRQNDIRVEVLKEKYPQGSEKQMIKALTGREIPSGGLPADANCVINNAATAAAIADAIKTGMPLIERVVTVSGGNIKNPANLLCRIGTPFIDLINACGGFWEEPTKIIMGGPMMGLAVANAEVPVLKCTGGILSLSKAETAEDIVQPCIRCARCVDACPQRLLPNLLGDFSEHDHHPQAKEYGALDCIECGCCTYVCPAKRNLVQLIKVSKGFLCKT